jgi:sugar/nucleoside kinase (ribokinase family)
MKSGKKHHVIAIENALLDFMIEGTPSQLTELGLTKGVMQLVDEKKQKTVLESLEKIGNTKPQIHPGGSAANCLRAMASLGSKTVYSSCVGKDSWGELFESKMRELGIEMKLGKTKEHHTGTCVVVVTPDGDRTLNTHLGACLNYDESYLPTNEIESSEILFTTGYVWDTPKQIQALEKAFKIAKESNTRIAFDVADPFVVQRWGTELNAVIKTHVHTLFANADEAKMLVGSTGKEAAKKLGEWVPLVCVKDSANGAFVCFEGEIFHAPAFPAQVLDTTGAGDFFAGGFLHSICAGHSVQTSLRYALASASLVIENLGVRVVPNFSQKVKTLVGGGV